MIALALALQAAEVPALPFKPEELIDPLARPCNWGGEGLNKNQTALMIGYLRGYLFGVAEACDTSEQGVCGRIRSVKSVATILDQPRVAGRMVELCKNQPDLWLKDIVNVILADAGLKPNSKIENR